MQFLLAVMICASLLKGYSSAEPSKCYYCEDTVACNDPVNIDNISTCTFLSVNDITNMTTFKKYNISLKQLDDINAATPTNRTGSTCAKLVLSNTSARSTARYCAYKYLDGLDTCKWLQQNLQLASGVSFNCNICDTDLCNSAAALRVSALAFVGLYFLVIASKYVL